MCDIIEITGDDRDTIFLTPAMLVFNGPLDTIVSCANFKIIYWVMEITPFPGHVGIVF